MRSARVHGSMGAREGAAARAHGRVAGHRASRAPMPPRSHALLLVFLLALIAPAAAAQQTVDGIHIWTDRSVDFFSRDTIIKSIIKPGMTNEQKAVACYELVRSRIFHFSRPDDNDPQRVLNVYGYALCGTIQHTLVWLAQGVFGPEGGRPAGLTSRKISNPDTFKIAAGGWLNDSMYRLDGARPPAKLGHSWCQLFYDGRYHYLDAHAGFYVYTADGKHIASIEEISGDPTLVTDPVKKSDPFMPCDKGRPEFFYRVAGSHRGRPVEKTNHSMALRVRPGETLVFHFDKLAGEHFKRSRSWKGQWSPDYYKEGPHLRSQGEKVKSYRHYGNGEIIFLPNLRKAGFKESLVESENLAHGSGRLSPKDPTKPASATFEFKSPYPMVSGMVSAMFDEGKTPPGTLTFISPVKKAKPQVFSASQKPGQIMLSIIGIRVSGKPDMRAAGYPYSARVRLSIPAGSHAQNLVVHFITQLNFHTLPRPLPGKNKVSFECATGSPRNAKLQIEWAWTEAGGKQKTARQMVGGKTFSYPLELGEVNTKPASNPKYMRSLKLSMPDD
jgi:hypothetical protein